MNILIPDSWLREHLHTEATPKQLKDCLSLCGPSIERIYEKEDDWVYDIEVTTNRVDMMSVRGIAREAALILPEFGIPASLLPFPAESGEIPNSGSKLDIKITNNPILCSRLLGMKLSNIHIHESPAWMRRKLELVGQRPLNAVVDVTNYVMWEVGHPIHVFDYDALKQKTIIVREAKKGETLTTLDRKTHTLLGGEIIFDDGTGTIIDLPGIMGTANTVVQNSTKNILLWTENADPVRIRRASMGLSIRSQAAVINEKQPDSELALIAMKRAIQLLEDVSNATVGSTLLDLYPEKPATTSCRLSLSHVNQYVGEELPAERIETILKGIGCMVKKKTGKESILFDITPPTLRSKDLQIPEDYIEEIARIVGYHTIAPRMPEGTLPFTVPDPILVQEAQIKKRLQGWGYTEIYAYSMISQKELDVFSIDSHDVYRIINPLSDDHEYLRPTLVPSMLACLAKNQSVRAELALFELSNTYLKQTNDLPQEQSELVVGLTGNGFLQLKGLAETIFSEYGISSQFPPITAEETYFVPEQSISLGEYGSVGMVHPTLLASYVIKKPVTVLRLSLSKIVQNAKSQQSYSPIPKHPPVIEDYTFLLPEKSYIGPILQSIQSLDPLIATVTVHDAFEQNRTIQVTYKHPERTLRDSEIKPLRKKIVHHVSEQFQGKLIGELP